MFTESSRRTFARIIDCSNYDYTSLFGFSAAAGGAGAGAPDGVGGGGGGGGGGGLGGSRSGFICTKFAQSIAGSFLSSNFFENGS